MKQLIGNVLYGFDEEVAEWVAQRIHGYSPEKGVKALGVVKDGALVAGVTYERWNGVHVEVSIAIDDPNWATRDTMFLLFAYPFIRLGCEAITVLVPSSNVKSINLATKMGFEPEALVKYAAFDGSSLVVMKMFKDKCRWIIRDGKRQQRTGGSGPV